MLKPVLALCVSACTVGSAGNPGGGGDPDGPLPPVDIPAGAASLRITATSSVSPNTATYAPRNITAVWIDNNGTFVKTIDRKANTRKASLVSWVAAAGAGDADAVTGATRANHATPLSITWDLKDKTGNVIADGTYNIKMEEADENATQPAQNNEATFTFVKGPTAQSQTGLSNGGFSAVSIDFTP